MRMLSSFPPWGEALLLSVIVEWENAGRIGAERSERMLATLAGQLRALGPDGTRREIVFVYDPMAVAAETVARAARLIGDAAAVQIVAAPGRFYYEQKNIGAARARGETLVFLDSDVIPEPGWLAAILAPLGRPGFAVSGGCTFVAGRGLYAAAMALAWFFPLRSAEGGVAPAKRFFANNVAFRRDIFLRFGFPETGQFRGQCTFLADALARGGIAIASARDARVAHPPPEGLGPFLRRALRNGHDDWLRARHRGQSGLRGIGALCGEYARAIGRIVTDHRRAGLGPGGAAFALALASLYHGAKLGAYLAMPLRSRLHRIEAPRYEASMTLPPAAPASRR